MTEAALAHDFFDTLHTLWHAHGCAPGDVDWYWDTNHNQAAVKPSGSKASRLAELIHEMTGEWPLPCGICDRSLQLRELTARMTAAQGLG